MAQKNDSNAAPHLVDTPRTKKRYARQNVRLKPTDDVCRINIDEMAARLDLDPRTIRRLIREGLPCLRMGKNILRFDAKKVLEWFDARFGASTTSGANR
jgi:hypothetical protein